MALFPSTIRFDATAEVVGADTIKNTAVDTIAEFNLAFRIHLLNDKQLQMQ